MKASLALKVNVPHIVSTIKAKFEAEGLIHKFFKIQSHSSSDEGGLLSLNEENCILLEFKTPYEEFPEVYKETHFYRLLVIFSLYEESTFAPPLQNAISRLRYQDNIDRTILWSTTELDPDISQILKEAKTDIVYLKLPTKDEITKTRSINHFIPIEEGDLAYSLMVNLIAERLIKRLRKMFHLVLSEIAAPIYENFYSQSKIATKKFMEFEEDRLNQLIKKLKIDGKNKIAIDVGCGTGRHSFALARHFETVYAYDFSPNMIDEANKLRRKHDIRNIFFRVNDFEYERLSDEGQFYGKCDLVVASFGMGSFIEDTSGMLRHFYDWLKPDGYMFISFYNGNSITLNVTPNWRDSALAAQIDRENNSLEVHLTPKTQFNIFCKLFDDGVEGEINRIFNTYTITTYPMIMALLPNSLLENDFARKAFVAADKTLADHEHKDKRHGYYAIVTACKGERETNGYHNVERLLREYSVEYEMLEHGPVLSMEDVKKEIGYFPKSMIKTILINNRKTDEFIVILLQSEKRLNMDQLADLLQVNRYHISFAREKDILRMGFPLGGVAPFGFQNGLTIRKFVDEAIVSHRCKWFYTGTGDNRKTLKIKKQDFLRLIEDYERIAF